MKCYLSNPRLGCSKPKEAPETTPFYCFLYGRFLFFIFIFYNHGLLFSYLICENDSFSMTLAHVLIKGGKLYYMVPLVLEIGHISSCSSMLVM